jgi:3',5'-cyclic AMP phosphodiesterase CpdA
MLGYGQGPSSPATERFWSSPSWARLEPPEFDLRSPRVVVVRTSLTFVHISDLHLSDPGPLDAAVWTSPKRLLAWNSWRRKRRHRFDRRILDAAARAIRNLEPAATLVTGDLTQLGLPREFEEARAWLPALGDPAQVALVPGNHDAQRREPWAKTMALWEPWLGDDLEPGREGANFPTCRVRHGVAILGVSTACPTPPLRASGRIGAAQLERLDARLAAEAEAGRPRIVLLHHPPVAGIVRDRKRLLDLAELHEVLERRGAELILHGHAHEPSEAWLRLGGREIPVVGAPALAEWRTDRPRGGRFHTYRFLDDAAVEITIHRWHDDSEAFVAEAPRILGGHRE